MTDYGVPSLRGIPVDGAPAPVAHAPGRDAAGAPRSMLAISMAIMAVTVAALALGWGFTQWSSAGDWRDRSEAMQQQFDDLNARVEKAERLRGRAERETAAVRRTLVKTEQRLVKLADQQAFTRDLRVALCETTQPFLPPVDRARVCS
jgi:hypothetical protein